MTEEEWLLCDHPTPLMQYLCRTIGGDRRTWFGPPSRGTLPRKWRLFLAACCERVAPYLNSNGRELVAFVKECADRVPEEADRERVRNWFLAGSGSREYRILLWALQSRLSRATGEARNAVGNYAYRSAAKSTDKEAAKQLALETEERLQGDLVRDIFGNPYQLAILEPAWQTSTVIALAQGMYEASEFSAMPILADALQDAGCDNADILEHCRGEGPHVRGCWVVDLLLVTE